MCGLSTQSLAGCSEESLDPYAKGYTLVSALPILILSLVINHTPYRRLNTWSSDKAGHAQPSFSPSAVQKGGILMRERRSQLREGEDGSPLQTCTRYLVLRRFATLNFASIFRSTGRAVRLATIFCSFSDVTQVNLAWTCIRVEVCDLGSGRRKNLENLLLKHGFVA